MGALVPLALSLAPEIGKWLFGNNQAATDTVQAVTQAVQDVTGTSDADMAQEVLARDPKVAADLRVSLAQIAAQREKELADTQLETLKQMVAMAGQQTDIDKADAASNDAFARRWRPFIGWVCGVGLAWAFVAAPLLTGLIHFWRPDVNMPEVDVGQLMFLITGMLGFGGLRTFEKLKGVAGK